MRKASIRRSWTVVGVFSALAIISVLGAAISNADEDFGFARLAGNDRYDTARDVAAKTFGTSEVVVIASGEAFPDALAAAFGAGLESAPILLTEKDSLPDPTSTAITSLQASSAVIVGGTAVVSNAVEQELKDDGLDTVRIAGDNRYDTAAQVAGSGGPDSIGTTGGPLPPPVPTAIVVSGQQFPDALAAGPASYASNLPILLTPTAALAPETRAFLESEDNAIGAVLIVGGTTAVSEAVEEEISEMEIEVTRIAGTNRSDTAAKMADYELENLEFSDAHVELARGDGFADALAAAPHGGKGPAPLLLTQDPNTLSSATRTWLEDHAETLTDGHILGGSAAVSEDVEEEGEAAAGNTTGSTTSTTGAAGPPEFVSAVLNYSFNPITESQSSTITVNYTEAVKCSSVHAKDFEVAVTDDNERDAGVGTVTCGNAAAETATSITITPLSLIHPDEEGTVTVVSGDPDGDTVLDTTDSAQAADEDISWVGPSFESAVGSTNTGNRVIITYNEALTCSTVAQTGSDYDVYLNGSNAETSPLSASCSGDTVTLTMPTLAQGDQGVVYLAGGKENSDTSTAQVANSKGSFQPTDDTISFIVV